MVLHFNKHVLIRLSITLLILLALGVYSYVSTQELIQTARLLSYTMRVINNAEQVLKIAVDIESGHRGYIITGDSSFLPPFAITAQKLADHLNLLDSILSADELQTGRMKKVHALVNKELEWSLKVTSSRIEGFEQAQALVSLGDGKKIMHELHESISEIQEHEREKFRDVNTVTTATLQKFQYSLLTFAIAAIAIILWLFYALNKSLQKRSEAENELRAASNEIRDLYNNAPCGYHSLDENGFFLVVNNTFLKWIGYEREELVNKFKFSDILTEDSVNIFKNNFPEFKKKGFVNDLEFDLIKKDGNIFPVLLNAKAVFDQKGNYTKSQSTTFDNANRKKSEKTVRDIIESAPDAMVIVDNQGTIRLVNKQTEKIFYYTKDELVGQPVEILIPQSKRSIHKTHVKHYFEHPANRPMGAGLELYGLRKTGETFPVEISLSPIDDSVDTLVTAAIRDITERKETEKMIAEMAAIVTFAEDAIISTTLEGQVFSWNKGAEELYGYTASEILGAQINLIIPENLRGREEKVFQKAVNGIPVKNYETLRRRKDGSFVNISLTVSPIRSKVGKIIGLSKIAHDITERKAREEEILYLNKELESFTYSVSHDLRAPLRSVSGYSQILLEDYSDKIDEEGKRVTQVIINNAKRMGQLIDDLLDFSRLSRRDLTFSTTNMNEVVNQAIKELNIDMENEGLTLSIEDLKPAEIDRNMILQVWLNLISNAIKYSKNREKIKIEIKSYIHKDELCYSISDNGTGFDMKYINKLFNVFQRLHKIDEYEGTGVGLAIVKRIVNKHGGRVWAEGKPDMGATFYFTIPSRIN